MDPFTTSSTTTTPVPTIEVGQGSSGTPQHGSHHQRAHPDNAGITSYDNLAGFDPFNINFIDSPLPPLPEVAIDPITLSEEELSYLTSGLSLPVGSLEGHKQSFSMNSDFDFLNYISDGGCFYRATSENLDENNDVVPAVNPMLHQVVSVGTDGSITNLSTDQAEVSGANNEVVKKDMPQEKVSELATVDPRRAKRMLANREFAARSKERKTQYTLELEKKVQTLREESSEVSANRAQKEKQTLDLEATKKEISCDMESIEKRAKVREDLNEVLKDKLKQMQAECKQKVAFKHHNFGGLVSQFSSQIAQHQVALLRSSQNKPNSMQSDSDDSSSDSED